MRSARERVKLDLRGKTDAGRHEVVPVGAA